MLVQAFRKNVTKEVAQMSGGEYTTFTGDKRFQQRVVDAAKHMRNRYLITFSPSDAYAGTAHNPRENNRRITAPGSLLAPITGSLQSHSEYLGSARSRLPAGSGIKAGKNSLIPEEFTDRC